MADRKKDHQKQYEVLYGPPPIDRHSYQGREPVVYGPPPIEFDSYQKPRPTVYGPPPMQKKLSCLFVVLIIAIVLGLIIAWLL